MTEEDRQTSPFPLYAHYPQLETSLPRLALSPGPSPVRELTGVSRKSFWIKNDGLYGTLYGGNKPRKLELVLPDAQRQGKSTIITFGALGTHHGLATALYARQLGLRTVLLLVDQPVDNTVRRALCWFQQAGAILHHTATARRTQVWARLFMLRYVDWRRGKLPYLLPPGGSSPLGTVGFVNAAFELADQVAAGELPEPETVVVTLGSAGTVAGLALGLRLAGLRSRLIAVRIGAHGTPEMVAQLANATAGVMRQRGADLPAGDIDPASIKVLTDWVGKGYGHSTPEAERAIALFTEKADLTLEHTYTAKTVAALLELLESGHLDTGPTLYWHTYNALPVPLAEPGPEDYRRLPRSLHRFFNTEA